ncbi:MULTISPECIES: polymer-forming cytoskeletal protein [Salinibaculum]|uniref:polymer-forming cytoskeletal protein n=1 Tax=Salinibaculum TaxID=2732368 RepID=UPI0030D3CF66
MTRQNTGRAVFAVGFVVLAMVPWMVAAETTVRPTVEVPAGETLNEDLTATAGRVLVRGTVDGDVTALSADVVVSGEVTGDVTAFAGRVDVSGRVGGKVNAIAGITDVGGDVDDGLSSIGGRLSVAGRVGGVLDAVGVFVDVEEDGRVTGRFQTTAVRTRVNGTVLGGGPILNRSLTGGPGTGDDGAGAARMLAASSVGAGLVQLLPGTVAQPSPLVSLGPGNLLRVSWVEAYRFLANLLLGAVLVGAFPRFSTRVSDLVGREPARTWVSGFAVTLLTPLVLVVFGLSLFGLPIAFAGGALFVVLSWVGSVYGRFALGMLTLAAVPRGLSYVDVDVSPVENRWVGLVVGAFIVEILLQIPAVGPVVDGLVLVLGLGAVTRLAYRSYRRTERSSDESGPEPVTATNAEETREE